MPDVAATAAPVHRIAAHAGDALGVLVVGGSRHRPARGDVGGIDADQIGIGKVEADVDQLDAPAITKDMNRFEAAERHREYGVDVGSVRRAGLDVDAAGQVHRDDGDSRGVDGGEHLGRGRTQRSRAGDPDDAVDHQIGCSWQGFDDATTGPGERCQRRGVDAVRVEHDGGGAHPATTQEGRGPQRVAAVVSGADDRAHPSAGDRTGAGLEFAGDCGGQSVGGPTHQGTVGQASQ